MTTYETIILIGNLIILIGTLLVGLIVLINGLSRRMDNLVILGLLYLLTSTAKIIQVAFRLKWAEIAFFQTAVPLLILEFTRQTFYRKREDKKLKIYLFYGITFVTYVISAYFAFLFTQSDFNERNLYNVAATFDILTVILPNIFTIIAAREAIQMLDPIIVEKYIISRLRIWIILSFIFSLAYGSWIFELIFPGEATYAYLNSISTIIGMFYMLGSYLLWVLPNWFKLYLNKGSQVRQPSSAETSTEEELQEELEVTPKFKGEMLNILGSYLAESIQSSELAARGHLRFAARSAYPNETVMNFNYSKWYTVLDHYLIDQLRKLNLDVDYNSISQNMQQQLKRSQSVITMAKH